MILKSMSRPSKPDSLISSSGWSLEENPISIQLNSDVYYGLS
jgi:hypothetical protein